MNPVDSQFLESFSDTVRAIYDAALSPDAWPVALHRIGELFAARGAVIYFNNGGGDTDFLFSEGVGHAVQIYQDEAWWQRDVHAQRAMEMHLTGGDIFTDQSVATKQEIETLPIFTDFFRKVGFGWLMGCVIVPDLDMFASVSVPRARERGPFTATEMDMLRLLSRHVEQALRLSLRIANLESAQRVLQQILDKIEAGLYVLDAQERIVLDNQVGRAQFSDFFTLSDGRLTALDKDSAPLFDTLLADARSAAGLQSTPRSCMLGSENDQRILISALPLTDSGRTQLNLTDTARTLVLTTPAEHDSLINPTALRDIFDLSLGEARLASLVGGGVTVRKAASQLGVTEGTARVVLKRIFQKLGVKRQAELVLRMSALGRHQSFHLEGYTNRS
ncbi:LuxR family transcriptional regulator [Labrenzia sp. 011]|uniref:helix-turn-helix transcriptional regulator n=1 Tax=Labrenzia sp. 011 TaxID=2171494 RepID=UPI0010575A28|nr:LuxR family transcriptional regulator [Labrenzia sp. 011]